MIDANQALGGTRHGTPKTSMKKSTHCDNLRYFTYKIYKSVRTCTMDGSGAAITATAKRALKPVVQSIGPFGSGVGSISTRFPP